jgi:Anaerobic dehydrogenases, typically selenocysteine-containing
MNATTKPTPESQLSRRNFLKTTSAALATTSVLGGLSVERSAFAAGGDTLKIALIGCGGRGSGAANQALSTSAPLKLVAMADVFKDRLEGSLQKS